jgi:hypothetical protein
MLARVAAELWRGDIPRAEQRRGKALAFDRLVLG